MPTYTFKDKNTGKEFIEFMSMSEREKYLKKNPNIEQVLTNFALVDPVRLGRFKPTEAFKDRLKEIKKSHRHSTVNTW